MNFCNHAANFNSFISVAVVLSFRILLISEAFRERRLLFKKIGEGWQTTDYTNSLREQIYGGRFHEAHDPQLSEDWSD